MNSHLINESVLKSNSLKKSPNMMLFENLKSFLFSHFYMNIDESAFISIRLD